MIDGIFDPASRSLVLPSGGRVPLQRKEWAVMQVLRRRHGAPVRWQRIIDEVYADDPDGGPLDAHQLVRVLIHQLRRKLSGSGLWIETVYGHGYRLVAS